MPSEEASEGQGAEWHTHTGTGCMLVRYASEFVPWGSLDLTDPALAAGMVRWLRKLAICTPKFILGLLSDLGRRSNWLSLQSFGTYVHITGRRSNS